MNNQDKKNGFTLIELIISIAILTVVLLGIYSLFGFGNRVYIGGTSQYDIQSSARLVEDYILKQVAYATEVEVMDITTMNANISASGGIETYDNYIYYRGSDNTIVHDTAFMTKLIGSIGTSGGLVFQYSSTDPREIEFSINGNQRQQTYTIPSKVACLNINMNNDKKIIGLTSGTAIRYKTVNDYLAVQLMPIAFLNGTNTEREFHIQYDRVITDAIVLTSENILNENIVLSSSSSIIITTDSASQNAYIVFRVTFGGTESFGNTYDYTATYDNLQWSIK